MARTIHMCLSVRGALRWGKREFRKALSWMTQDGRRFESIEHLREALMDELAKGHEVLPVGEICEGFDWKTGCPGHEVKSDAPVHEGVKG